MILVMTAFISACDWKGSSHANYGLGGNWIGTIDLSWQGDPTVYRYNVVAIMTDDGHIEMNFAMSPTHYGCGKYTLERDHFQATLNKCGNQGNYIHGELDAAYYESSDKLEGFYQDLDDEKFTGYFTIRRE